MATQATAAAVPVVKAPVLVSVRLLFSAALNGSPQDYFHASKFRLEQDQRGDVRIYLGSKHLFVPKGLAILEFEEPALG
jgi:hypothetical protein